MTTRIRLVDRVDDRIDEFLTDRSPILLAIGDDVGLVERISRDFLSGGKRFRARFCSAGLRAIAAAPGSGRFEAEEAVPGVAAALEIFHAAALVHDDVIDNSDTRRGAPAAHIRFASDHRDSGFSGDADAHGRSAAILLGDLLLGWSDELLDESIEGLASRADSRRARREFNRMRTEVTLGQYLDILEESAWSTHPASEHVERAHRVIVYKSAKYSIEAPIAIGAALGGASDEQLDALRAFGLPLGVAFQLRDDLLGVFGDAAITGKPSGDDLREGKRTVLVALAARTLDDAGRAALDAVLGDQTATDAAIAAAQNAIEASGAVDEVERLIAAATSEALSALDSPLLTPDGVAELRALAEAVTQRSA